MAQRSLGRAKVGAVWLYVSCQLLVILDTSGLNTALAAIGADFRVPVDVTATINLWFAVTLAVTHYTTAYVTLGLLVGAPACRAGDQCSGSGSDGRDTDL